MALADYSKRDAWDLSGVTFTKGKGRLGPEHYGCMNTGMRPCIYKTKWSGLFFVGMEFDVQTAIDIRKNHSGHVRKFRENPKSRRWVQITKGRGPAVERFYELCNEVLSWNQREQKSHQDALVKSRSDNPAERVEGAMALLDH